MSERMITVAHDVEVCVEELGDPRGPTVLLMMGMGLQLVWWREDFCQALLDRGFHVVRYDHRDIGRSTCCPGPSVSAMGFLTRRAQPTYTLEDLADDAGTLIGTLGHGPAHVVGVSLGSFVAQATAIRWPDRVASLTSIMGRPGDGRTGKVAWSARKEFLRQGPRDPEGAVEHLVRTFHRIGSENRTVQDDEDVRLAVKRSAMRDRTDGAGGGRQLAAVIAERDRTPDLQRLRVPALVVHGLRDKIIVPSGGRATAAAIPNAELLEIPRMGHDLARWTWPDVLDGIERTAARAAT